MYRKAIKLLKTQTAKDASIMSVSTAIASVVAAVFFILAARLLGPSEFGIFSLATAASFMFADIFDIALNTSLIRFVSKEIQKEDGKEDQYLSLFFKTKIVIGLLLILVVSVLAIPLSKLLFARTFPQAIIYASIGTAFQLIYTFGLSHLQARREFLKSGGGIIALSSIRLVGFLILVLTKSIQLLAVLAIYFFTIPIAALANIFIAPRKFLKVSTEKSITKEVLKYNLPLTVAFALATISSRVDNFILVNMESVEAVGFYAAAYRLYAPAQFLAGALSTVFAPRFASFENLNQTKTYFKKTLAAIALLSTSLLLVIPLSPFVIHLFYGSEYQSSIKILQILTFGFIAFLLQAPFTSTILYYFAKTNLFAAVTAIQLVIVVLANFLLIPIFHENGSAMAFVISQASVLVVLAFITTIKLRSNPK